MEPPSRNQVDLISRSAIPGASAAIRRAVRSALDAFAGRPSSVCVRLVARDEIQTLNQRFRNLDEPTDVLAFPAPEALEREHLVLGDVAVCVEIAEEQALLRNVAIETELASLAVHGTLHLLGFRDKAEGERVEMIGAMRKALSMAGIEMGPDWHSTSSEGKMETAR